MFQNLVLQKPTQVATHVLTHLAHCERQIGTVTNVIDQILQLDYFVDKQYLCPKGKTPYLAVDLYRSVAPKPCCRPAFGSLVLGCLYSLCARGSISIVSRRGSGQPLAGSSGNRCDRRDLPRQPRRGCARVGAAAPELPQPGGAGAGAASNQVTDQAQMPLGLGS